MQHGILTSNRCAPMQELYKCIAWPLYRLSGHAFDAFRTMVVDEGEAMFQKLEQEYGGPIPVLTPEVSISMLAGRASICLA